MIKLPKPKNEGGLIGNINNHPTQVSGPHKSQESPHLLSYNTTQHNTHCYLFFALQISITSLPMAAITGIKARQIFDSRGNPTVEVRLLFHFDTSHVSVSVSVRSVCPHFPPLTFLLFVTIFHFTPRRYLFI